MNERNSDWQYVATVAVGKNQLLMQQAIYSATVAVDIRRTATVAVDICRPLEVCKLRFFSSGSGYFTARVILITVKSRQKPSKADKSRQETDKSRQETDKNRQKPSKDRQKPSKSQGSY